MIGSVLGRVGRHVQVRHTALSAMEGSFQCSVASVSTLDKHDSVVLRPFEMINHRNTH